MGFLDVASPPLLKVDTKADITGTEYWLSERERLSLLSWCRRSIAEPALSVLFPPRCAGCGDFEAHLCEKCRSSLVAADEESCPRCGEPGPRPLVSGRCSVCMDSDIEYDRAGSAFVHQGAARSLVSNFKLGGQPGLAEVMADLARPAFVRFLAAIGAKPPLLSTWVPSHPSSERQRGYNQAELFAKCLVRPLHSAACMQLVVKTGSTRHQRALHRQERLTNLKGSFSPGPDMSKAGLPARHPAECKYSGVVLVDDVSTTGATVAAVSAVLRSSTGLPVHVFTFSRAVSAATERHD